MNKAVEEEVKSIIKKFKLDCSVEEFQDKVNWNYISRYQKLSESFIREFQDKVNWDYISYYQKLSEEFIREFQDKVIWDYISYNQKLSESFIREFQDKVIWINISSSQELSESFIREFKDKIDIKIQALSHKEKSIKEKTKEIKEYAKKYKLEFDGKYLYAFREHDEYGRGMFNKTIFYEKGKYYRDWHCDMNKENENSFGLGIFSKGDTKIKVKVEDWGIEVDREDGKARVWGIEVI